MLRKHLNFKEILMSVFVLLLLGCNGKTVNHKKQVQITEANKYESYFSNEVFNSEQFLKDNSGPWVCFKYVKDTVRSKYPMFEYDENYAKEISRYYSFVFRQDTLVVNNQFRIPISCYVDKVDSLLKLGLGKTYRTYHTESETVANEKIVYSIGSKKGMRYKDYCEELMKKGDTIPYYNFANDPIRPSRWCFPNVIAFYHDGYNYYFKKGKSKNTGIIGIPSDKNNHFIVQKTYSHCTIEEAVYKMIEDFPKGTMNLLDYDDEPDVNGEFKGSFPQTSGFNYGESTQYIWHNDNSVTVRVGKTRNSTFVFEFKKKDKDVYVKYWNDVTFPFEEGFHGY